MTDEPNDLPRATANRVIELEEELEASGVAPVDESELERGRSVLHQWVNEMVGFVVSPGLGRVTLIHADGRPSTISSSTLPYRMSKPLA
ncbi:MAG: hypothetical protein ABIO85_06400 [Sphingomicrobium sp.]